MTHILQNLYNYSLYLQITQLDGGYFSQCMASELFVWYAQNLILLFDIMSAQIWWVFFRYIISSLHFEHKSMCVCFGAIDKATNLSISIYLFRKNTHFVFPNSQKFCDIIFFAATNSFYSAYSPMALVALYSTCNSYWMSYRRKNE